MNRFILWFVKITGLPAQYFYYKKKIYYENNNKKLRKIDGGALIVSNHTSIYDFPLMMYVFLKRNIRTLVAEVIYQKNKFMSRFMTYLGAIRVDRNSYDFAFMSQMVNCLQKGQVGLVFPEARIPLENEKDTLLPFKPSFVYLALESDVPIIPVYTNGVYGKLKKKNKSRAKVIIGEKIYPTELIDKNKTQKENIEFICNYVRDYIIRLGKELDSK